MQSNSVNGFPESTLSFITDVAGEDVRRIEESFSDGFVRLAPLEAAKRQAKHDIRYVEDAVIELLRNSRDAGATKIFIATCTNSTQRTITIFDNGSGIPSGMTHIIFEPRVTSKLDSMSFDEWGVHGRGMALFSIASNCEKAQVIRSSVNKGTVMQIIANTDSLPERADQSTWPKLEKNLTIKKGPHNIVRKVSEFALLHPEIKLFIGSNAEMVATIFQQKLDKNFACKTAEISPTRIDDYLDFSRDNSIEISERTAYRISLNEISPRSDVLSMLREKEKRSRPDEDTWGLESFQKVKIARNDLDAFGDQVAEAFENLAESYFLQISDEVKVTQSTHKLTISVTFEHQ